MVKSLVRYDGHVVSEVRGTTSGVSLSIPYHTIKRSCLYSGPAQHPRVVGERGQLFELAGAEVHGADPFIPLASPSPLHERMIVMLCYGMPAT